MVRHEGRLAQRESACFTRKRSLVRNQRRPPDPPLGPDLNSKEPRRSRPGGGREGRRNLPGTCRIKRLAILSAGLEVGKMAAMRRAERGRSTGPSRPAARRQPAMRAGYEHFRLERQGALVSPSTLDYYDAMVLPFLTWLDGEGVQRFEHLDVNHARLYRARLASTPGRHGRPL